MIPPKQSEEIRDIVTSQVPEKSKYDYCTRVAEPEADSDTMASNLEYR